MGKTIFKYREIGVNQIICVGLFVFIFLQNFVLSAQNEPYCIQKFYNTKQIDSSINNLPWSEFLFINFKKDSSTIFIKKIFHDHFLNIKTPKRYFLIDPQILVATASETNRGKSYFVTGGGIKIHVQQKKQIGFWTTLNAYKTDGFLQDSTRTADNLLPGILCVKQRENGYLALNPKFRIAYRPGKFFQFEAGLDNHFAGDGYHSVLLGGNGTPHPFGQISTSFWKVDYLVNYHFLKDIQWPNTQQLENKYMTTHQLNFRATSKLHFYVYEAVVWKHEDSITQRGYDISYLNPIIFFRPVEFQLGSPSPDNVLMGAGFRFQPTKWLRIYGQGLIDELSFSEITSDSGWWANKYALQIGLTINYMLNEHRVKFLAEYNMARPFTYSHIGSMQNYGNRYYPLAHPLGANFGELLIAAKWNYKRIKALFKIVFTSIGQNSVDINYGQNIYRSYTDRESEYGHTWLQGNKTNMVLGNIQLGYVLNPKMNLTLSTGFRRIANLASSNVSAIYFNEIYLRLHTFLSSDMKKFYRNTTMVR